MSVSGMYAGFRQSFLVCQNGVYICFGANKNNELGLEKKEIISKPEFNAIFEN
jgi:hypothetical protein